MNGLLPSSSNVVDVKLKRGPTGLGFNIVGGVDQQYIVNDSGIYVSKIKGDGAAAIDGRIEEGDKILAINGVSLENHTHQAAVELFRGAGEDVELRILKRSPHHKNGIYGSPPEPKSSLTPLGILLGLAGATAIFLFIYRRHFKKPF